MSDGHILIIRLSAMGDVAMTVPIVHALANQYPNLRITVLSRGFASAFFSNLAPNVSFIEADFKKQYKGLQGLNVLYRHLKTERFTAVADLHDVLRTKYLRMRFACSGIKVRHIDKHRRLRRQLTSRSRNGRISLPSSFQNYADVMASLGYPVTPAFRSIFPENGAEQSLLPPTLQQKPDNEKWMGIAPFAAHEGKVYPLVKMERVISSLSQRFPHLRIFLFGGGRKEKEILDNWCLHHPACTNASSLLSSLKEELTLMSQLDVMLSMDSANAHLASLVNTRVVSIWGATHPCAGFMAWNQNPDDAIQVELPCRPCSIYGNKPCHRNDFACMQEIEPQQIVNQLALHLTSNRQEIQIIYKRIIN